MPSFENRNDTSTQNDFSICITGHQSQNEGSHAHCANARFWQPLTSYITTVLQEGDKVLSCGLVFSCHNFPRSFIRFTPQPDFWSAHIQRTHLLGQHPHGTAWRANFKHGRGSCSRSTVYDAVKEPIVSTDMRSTHVTMCRMFPFKR